MAEYLTINALGSALSIICMVLVMKTLAGTLHHHPLIQTSLVNPGSCSKHGEKIWGQNLEAKEDPLCIFSYNTHHRDNKNACIEEMIP